MIGAGPSGLALSALLKRDGVEHVILEKAPVAGGTYARVHPEFPLLSPGEYSVLPLAEERLERGDMGMGRYTAYLREYVEAHSLPLRLSTEVKRVRALDSGYEVELAGGERLRAARVAVCTGMSSFPKKIAFSPERNPSVRYEETMDWRGSESYRGQSVLVAGSGTSACELATFLAGKTAVALALRGELRTMPLEIFGWNVHHPLRWLEALPRGFFRDVCEGRWKDPAIDNGIRRAIAASQVRVVPDEFTLEGGVARFRDGSELRVDILINATGFIYDLGILPAEVARRPNGHALTKRCESVSHLGLYFIGHPCAARIDSKFLRGIYKDAFRVAAAIRARHQAS